MFKNKVANDVKKYLFGIREFNYIESGKSMLYPIDLEFTLENEQAYYYPKDKDGIPQKHYRSVGLTYNPTRVSAYGLSHWNRYQQTRNNVSLEKFKTVLNWFMQKHSGGKWYYNFNWGNLKAPWISCMSQGEAISILVRGYILTNNIKYLEIAILALKPFYETVNNGGVLSEIDEHSIFFEEYPEDDSKHVLNGYLYALIGIIELEKVMNEKQTSYENVRSLLTEAINSLEENISRWDLGYWSVYDLYNENNSVRNACTISYHCLHISQLKFIGTVLNNDKILNVSKKWESYINNPFNRIRALIMKSYFRYKNPAQR